MSRAVSTAAVALLAVVGLLARAGVALGGEVTLSAPRADVGAGDEATVVIRARADAETSALQGGLSYDHQLIEVLEVTAGSALPEGARADFNADQPGWLRLGFVASPSKSAFRGEGEVLRIRLRVKGGPGVEVPLRLSKVRAWQPDDTEHRAVTEDGSLRIVKASGLPLVPLAIGAGILLLVLFAATRRRRPQASRTARAAAPAPSSTRTAGTAPAGTRSPTGRGRFCTSCGTPAKDAAARFCGTCGTELG